MSRTLTGWIFAGGRVIRRSLGELTAVETAANLQRALDLCDQALDELGQNAPDTDAAKVLIEGIRTELLAVGANEDAGLTTSR